MAGRKKKEGSIEGIGGLDIWTNSSGQLCLQGLLKTDLIYPTFVCVCTKTLH